MFVHRIVPILFVLFAAMLLQACGGDNSSNENSPTGIVNAGQSVLPVPGDVAKALTVAGGSLQVQIVAVNATNGESTTVDLQNAVSSSDGSTISGNITLKPGTYTLSVEYYFSGVATCQSALHVANLNGSDRVTITANSTTWASFDSTKLVSSGFDDDSDKFSNLDEVNARSSPCSSASTPAIAITTTTSTMTTKSTSTSSTVSSATSTTIATSGPGIVDGGYFMYGTPDPKNPSQFTSLSVVAINDFSSTRVLTDKHAEHAATIQTADYDTATKTMSNIRPSIAVVAQSGQWWSAPLVGGIQLPQLKAISAVAYGSSGLGPLCPELGVIGGISLSQTYIVYETGGADNNCDQRTDNKRFVLSVNGGTGFFVPGGIEITSLVSSVNDFAVLADVTDPSQTPVNIVAVNGKDLVRYTNGFSSPNPFGSPVKIATATSNEPIGLNIHDGSDARGFFVRMDNNIYWYDRQTNKLGNSLYPLGAVESLGTCDATDCYFVESAQTSDGSTKTRILRLPWATTTTAQLVVDNITERLKQIALTGSSVFALATGSGQFSVRSVAKSGGTSLTLRDTSAYITSIQTSGNFVYYAKRAPNSIAIPPNGMSAITLNADGSMANQIDNAFWTGSVVSRLSLTGASTRGIHPDKLVLASGISSTAGAGLSGATLQTYSASTNTAGNALGKVPNNITGIYVSGFLDRVVGYGNDGLHHDLVGVDLNKSDSFVAITNTPTDDEVPVN